ncbi:MAG TPA: hypothetical protein VGI46_15430 [Candidatus Acidoferrum sp.]|jgi:hypothetical protein
MQKRSWREWLILAAVLAVPAIALSQAGDSKGTLIIAGQDGQAPVVRIQGKTYVELEALARLTHGSLTFEGSQTTLTLPGTAAPATTPAATSDFSRPFLRAAIEEMAVIREWRITLTNAIQRGIPVTSDWTDLYRSPAQTNLHLASVAAETDSDRNAYQLLSNEFENMRKLSDRVVAQHDSQTYASPDALLNDPLNQQILSCARALAAMATSGQYVDDGSCH